MAGTEFVAPRNPIEKILASIWADLLGIDHVGVSEQLLRSGRPFAFGGPGSGARRECLGVSLPIKAFFEAPTVEALARHVERRRGAVERAATRDRPRRRRRPPPVSIVQEHVLRIERNSLDCPSSIYPLPIDCRAR